MDESSGSESMLSKSASAYEHIRRLIIQGQLRPGRRLTPSDLAARYDISATPVRDALVRLSAEGFIRSEVSRGYFTKPWTVEEQRDLRQLLSITYVSSLELARASGAVVAPIFERWREKREGSSDAGVTSGQAYVAALDQLYVELVDVAGNTMMGFIVRNLVARTRLIRSLDFEAAEHRDVATAALEKIGEAVATNDLPSAIEEAQVAFAQIVARLPAVVGLANIEALKLRFP